MPGVTASNGDAGAVVIREGVAGILLREQEKLESLKGREKRWTDKELSRAYALKAIKSVQPRLEKLIPDNNWQKAVNNLKEYTKKWY